MTLLPETPTLTSLRRTWGLCRDPVPVVDDPFTLAAGGGVTGSFLDSSQQQQKKNTKESHRTKNLVSWKNLKQNDDVKVCILCCEQNNVSPVFEKILLKLNKMELLYNVFSKREEKSNICVLNNIINKTLTLSFLSHSKTCKTKSLHGGFCPQWVKVQKHGF